MPEPSRSGSTDRIAGRPTRTAATRRAALLGLVATMGVFLVVEALPATAQPDRTTPRETTTTIDRSTGDRSTSTTTRPSSSTTSEPDEETTTTAPPTTSATTTSEVPPPTAEQTGDEPEADDSTGSGGSLMLVLGILLGASAGAAIGWFAGRGAPGAGSGSTQPAPAPVGAPATPEPVADQRATLVAACIAAVDLAQNEGVREQLTRALESAGVTRLEVDGETFDPNRHHAVDRLHTHDPAQHNTVITDRAGWLDGNQILRLPDVIVYRTD